MKVYTPDISVVEVVRKEAVLVLEVVQDLDQVLALKVALMMIKLVKVVALIRRLVLVKRNQEMLLVAIKHQTANKLYYQPRIISYTAACILLYNSRMLECMYNTVGFIV